MKALRWDKVLKHLASTYYTELFLLACILVFLCIAFKVPNKEKPLIRFIVYALSCMLLFVFCWSLFLFQVLAKKRLIYLECSNIMFAIIESYVFFTFFNKILNNRIIKILMTAVFALLITSSITFYVLVLTNKASLENILQFADTITSAELVALGILCLVYYFNLLNTPTEGSLFGRPSFLIATGLFFYAFTIIPFFLMQYILRFNKGDIYLLFLFYGFHFVLLGFLFLSMSKAVLCKRPLIT